MLKKSLLALLVAVASAEAAECADRFALVTVANTSNVTLNFSYQVGPAAWQPVGLAPGQSFVIYSAFTGPGSYVYAPIRVAYDEDLHSGRTCWQVFLPAVRYSPDIDIRRGALYFYDYDGATGQFVTMYGPN